MREHQITINLRPDQFQEVQRLSRAAGARSIGLFAREKLLLTLGLSGAAAGPARTGSPDLASVTNDVRRLHRELQTFIGESLSGKDYAYDTMSTPSQAESASPSELEHTDISASDSNYLIGEHELSSSPVGDEMEDLAERAFAISPRLGSIEELSDEEITYSDPLDELLGDIRALEETPELQGIILASGTEADDRALSDGSVENQGLDGEEIAEVYEGLDQIDDEEFADADTESHAEADTEAEADADADTDDIDVDDEATEKAVGHDTTSDVDEEDQSGTEAADSPTDPPTPPTNFPNIPPISGGPPPRKRRT